MKKYALMGGVLILLFTLNIGHSFFPNEAITPTDNLTEMIKHSHYSWSFFIYELFQILSPLVLFILCYYIFKSIDKEKILSIKQWRYISLIMIGFHIYKLRIFLRFDRELDLTHYVIVENYIVCLAALVCLFLVMKTYALSTIGFDSIGDMMSSVFAIKGKSYGIYLFAPVIGGIITFIENNFETYIYDPAFGMGVLWMSALFDIVLGWRKAKVNNEFSSDKLVKGGIKVIVKTIFVMLIFNAVNAWPTYLGMWMADSIIILFTFAFIISAARNAYTLGLINKDLYEGIEKIVNLKDLLKKKKE